MPEPQNLALFSSDEQLARLETRHTQAPSDPGAALALAWALRQREAERSLALARTAAQGDERLLPRLWLIEGNHATAHGRAAESQAACERAQVAFEAAGDLLGLVDAALLAFMAARVRSVDPALLVPLLERLLEAAEGAGDADRLDYCRLFAARHYIWLYGVDGLPRSEPLLPAPDAPLHPAAAAMQALYWAMALAYRGGTGSVLPRRLELLFECENLALNTGQGWLAVTAANAHAFLQINVGEFAAALERGSTAIALARQHWPALLSECLWTNGRALLRLGQLPQARELLQECLQLETPRLPSRVGAHAEAELGQLESVGGNLQVARGHFERAITSPELRGSSRHMVLVDYAECLLKLGLHAQAEAALAQAAQTEGQHLMIAQGLQARAVLGDVWLGQGRVAEAQQAYAALMADIDAQSSLKPLAATLEGAARAHAAAGLHAEAYALSQRALATVKSRQDHENEQRSRAFFTQFRRERAQLEAEHMRRLAEASAGRLAALEMSHVVLERLGTIGRELTAQLDGGRALAVLARHVRALLRVDCLMVYLLDEAGETLECALCEDKGVAVPGEPRALADPDSLIARCARERQVLQMEDEQRQGVRLPGTAPKRSLLFAPLTIGTRVIGVMSVQSEAAKAFGPETRLIFDTLCAYAAIALDNARAYQQLDAMQRRLRAQERMASMGVLVAGISHELNTPLGNAVLAVSTLRQGAEGMEQAMAEGTMRRSALQAFLGDARRALEIVGDSLQRLGLLSADFKEVAQDRSQLQRQRVLLHEVIDQGLHLGRIHIDLAGHELAVEADPALALDTFGGPLAKALSLALVNAWQHGLAGRSGGRVLVRAQAQEDGVLVSIEDNGAGMSEAVRRRAFEPFFTTRMGPHTGLGLTILHNIVADMLGGEVELESTPGEGTRLSLRLPPLPE